MGNYNQGVFTPKNPSKLIGNAQPKWRSSWELSMMSFLDSHPSVIQWASESIKIPYKNPLTGKQSQYVPDFLVLYQDKNGAQRAELIEVKPKKEAFLENTISKRDKVALILNTAKFTAALEFCHKNGLIFRIVSEDELFPKTGKQLKNKR